MAGARVTVAGVLPWDKLKELRDKVKDKVVDTVADALLAAPPPGGGSGPRALPTRTPTTRSSTPPEARHPGRGTIAYSPGDPVYVDGRSPDGAATAIGDAKGRPLDPAEAPRVPHGTEGKVVNIGNHPERGRFISVRFAAPVTGPDGKKHDVLRFAWRGDGTDDIVNALPEAQRSWAREAAQPKRKRVPVDHALQWDRKKLDWVEVPEDLRQASDAALALADAADDRASSVAAQRALKDVAARAEHTGLSDFCDEHKAKAHDLWSADHARGGARVTAGADSAWGAWVQPDGTWHTVSFEHELWAQTNADVFGIDVARAHEDEEAPGNRALLDAGWVRVAGGSGIEARPRAGRDLVVRVAKQLAKKHDLGSSVFVNLDPDYARYVELHVIAPGRIDARDLARLDQLFGSPAGRAAGARVTAVLGEQPAVEMANHLLETSEGWAQAVLLARELAVEASADEHLYWRAVLAELERLHHRTKGFAAPSTDILHEVVRRGANNLAAYRNAGVGTDAGRDIVVTIPAARLADVEAEEADVASRLAAGEQGITYDWIMGRMPKAQPSRVYFAWGGAVRAYHDVVGMQPDRLVLDPAIHPVDPVPMAPFRGFRYWPSASSSRGAAVRVTADLIPPPDTSFVVEALVHWSSALDQAYDEEYTAYRQRDRHGGLPHLVANLIGPELKARAGIELTAAMWTPGSPAPGYQWITGASIRSLKYGNGVRERHLYLYLSEAIIPQGPKVWREVVRDELAAEIGRVVAHELIHVEQHTRRDNRLPNRHQNVPYHERPYEIEAYAHDIVRELRTADTPDIRKGTDLYDSPTYREYNGRFHDRPDIMNRLKRLIYEYWLAGEAPAASTRSTDEPETEVRAAARVTADLGGDQLANLKRIYRDEYLWSQLEQAAARGPLPEQAEMRRLQLASQLGVEVNRELSKIAWSYKRWLANHPQDVVNFQENKRLRDAMTSWIRQLAGTVAGPGKTPEDEKRRVRLIEALNQADDFEAMRAWLEGFGDPELDRILSVLEERAHTQQPRIQSYQRVQSELAKLEALHVDQLPLRQRVVELHRALTTAHNNGTMAEHVYNEGDDDQDIAGELTTLSNMPIPPAWDQEIHRLLSMPRGGAHRVARLVRLEHQGDVLEAVLEDGAVHTLPGNIDQAHQQLEALGVTEVEWNGEVYDLNDWAIEAVEDRSLPHVAYPRALSAAEVYTAAPTAQHGKVIGGVELAPGHVMWAYRTRRRQPVPSIHFGEVIDGKETHHTDLPMALLFLPNLNDPGNLDFGRTFKGNADSWSRVQAKLKPEFLNMMSATQAFDRVQRRVRQLERAHAKPQQQEPEMPTSAAVSVRAVHGLARQGKDMKPHGETAWHGLDIAWEALGGETRGPRSQYPQYIDPAIFGQAGGMGYFPGLEAEDGDSLDVIGGPDAALGGGVGSHAPGSPEEVFLIEQRSPEPPHDHVQWKVLIGFADRAAAVGAFRHLWPPPEMLGQVITLDADGFLDLALPLLAPDDGTEQGTSGTLGLHAGAGPGMVRVTAAPAVVDRGSIVVDGVRHVRVTAGPVTFDDAPTSRVDPFSELFDDSVEQGAAPGSRPVSVAPTPAPTASPAVLPAKAVAKLQAAGFVMSDAESWVLHASDEAEVVIDIVPSTRGFVALEIRSFVVQVGAGWKKVYQSSVHVPTHTVGMQLTEALQALNWALGQAKTAIEPSDAPSRTPPGSEWWRGYRSMPEPEANDLSNLTAIYRLEYQLAMLKGAATPLPEKAYKVQYQWAGELSARVDAELKTLHDGFGHWLWQENQYYRGTGDSDEDVFQRAEEIGERLGKPPKALNQRIVLMHEALTTAHNNGSMAAFVYAGDGRGKSQTWYVRQLDALSDTHPDSWDEELYRLTSMPRGGARRFAAARVTVAFVAPPTLELTDVHEHSPQTPGGRPPGVLDEDEANAEIVTEIRGRLRDGKSPESLVSWARDYWRGGRAGYRPLTEYLASSARIVEAPGAARTASVRVAKGPPLRPVGNGVYEGEAGGHKVRVTKGPTGFDVELDGVTITTSPDVLAGQPGDGAVATLADARALIDERLGYGQGLPRKPWPKAGPPQDVKHEQGWMLPDAWGQGRLTTDNPELTRKYDVGSEDACKDWRRELKDPERSPFIERRRVRVQHEKQIQDALSRSVRPRIPYTPKRAVPPPSTATLESIGITQGGGYENILKTLKAARPDEVAYWQDWYIHAATDAKALGALYKVPWQVVAGIIAALSPNLLWEDNVLAAEQILRGQGQKVIEYRRRTDPLAADNFLRKLFPVAYENPTTLGTFGYLRNITKAQRIYDTWFNGGAKNGETKVEPPGESGTLRVYWTDSEAAKNAVKEGAAFTTEADAQKRYADARRRGYDVFYFSGTGEKKINKTGAMLTFNPAAGRMYLVAPIAGPKVTAFYNSILHGPNASAEPVLDGHAQNIWRGEDRPLDDSSNAEAWTPERKQMRADYQKAAKRFRYKDANGDWQKLTPQQVQAITWTVWRDATATKTRGPAGGAGTADEAFDTTASLASLVGRRVGYAARVTVIGALDFSRPRKVHVDVKYHDNGSLLATLEREGKSGVPPLTWKRIEDQIEEILDRTPDEGEYDFDFDDFVLLETSAYPGGLFGTDYTYALRCTVTLYVPGADRSGGRVVAIAMTLPSKEVTWRTILTASNLDTPGNFVAADQRYRHWKRQWRAHRGPKPIYHGGELDPVRTVLGDEAQLSGVLEAFERLTAGVRSWLDPKLHYAVQVLSRVSGLEGLKLPDFVYERVADDQQRQQHQQEQEDYDQERADEREVTPEEAAGLSTGRFEWNPAQLDDPTERVAARVVVAAQGGPLRIDELRDALSRPDQFAVLSGYRGEALRQPANKARHGILIARLQQMGYRPGQIRPLRGQWGATNSPEKSVLVFGMPFKHAVELGRVFGQDAVIWKARDGLLGMYATDGSGKVQFPIVDNQLVHGPAAVDAKPRGAKTPGPGGARQAPATRPGDLYSKARGISFSFPFDWDRAWKATPGKPVSKAEAQRLLHAWPNGNTGEAVHSTV